MSLAEGQSDQGDPLKKSKKSAEQRAAETPHDITAQWPFVERRKGERRQHDRRRPAPPAGRAQPTAREVCTTREQEIIQLLMQGMTNKQIAQTLGIAEETVKKHLHHVYKKLGVPRRALLMVARGGTPKN